MEGKILHIMGILEIQRNEHEDFCTRHTGFGPNCEP
jgi:hypothetical protein